MCGGASDAIGRVRGQPRCAMCGGAPDVKGSEIVGRPSSTLNSLPSTTHILCSPHLHVKCELVFSALLDTATTMSANAVALTVPSMSRPNSPPSETSKTKTGSTRRAGEAGPSS